MVWSALTREVLRTKACARARVCVCEGLARTRVEGGARCVVRGCMRLFFFSLVSSFPENVGRGEGM